MILFIDSGEDISEVQPITTSKHTTSTSKQPSSLSTPTPTSSDTANPQNGK
jgi:hypothetical protein